MKDSLDSQVATAADASLLKLTKIQRAVLLCLVLFSMLYQSWLAVLYIFPVINVQQFLGLLSGVQALSYILVYVALARYFKLRDEIFVSIIIYVYIAFQVLPWIVNPLLANTLSVSNFATFTQYKLFSFVLIETLISILVLVGHKNAAGIQKNIKYWAIMSLISISVYAMQLMLVFALNDLYVNYHVILMSISFARMGILLVSNIFLFLFFYKTELKVKKGALE